MAYERDDWESGNWEYDFARTEPDETAIDKWMEENEEDELWWPYDGHEVRAVKIPIRHRSNTENNLVLRGINLLKHDSLDGARIVFKRVISRNPSNYRAIYGLGIIAWEQRRLDSAFNKFTAIADKANNYGIGRMSRIYLARILDIQGERESAIILYQTASESSNHSIRSFGKYGLENRFKSVSEEEHITGSRSYARRVLDFCAI